MAGLFPSPLGRIVGMASPAVIPALASVVRGLSALFWGLPLVLLLAAKTALDDAWRTWGLLPVVLAAGLLVFGVLQLRGFQPGERIWRSALERALVLALMLVALAPVSYWWNRAPAEPFFAAGLVLLMFAGLTFLLALNQVLVRLSAMLPDETLRSETRFFARWNGRLLVAMGLVLAAYLLLSRLPRLPEELIGVWLVLDLIKSWLVLLLALLPVALTMTLLWKTKEVILAGVFHAGGPTAEL